MQPMTHSPQEKDAMLYSLTGKTALLEALLHGSAIPASWSALDSSCSLLSLAAQRGHIDTMRWLLEHGADPNWVGRDGWALDVAVCWKERHSVRFLLPLTASGSVTSAQDKIAEALKEPPAILPTGDPIPPPQSVIPAESKIVAR
jgi:hypothetical protein